MGIFRGIVPNTLRRTLMCAMSWVIYEEVICQVDKVLRIGELFDVVCSADNPLCPDFPFSSLLLFSSLLFSLPFPSLLFSSLYSPLLSSPPLPNIEALIVPPPPNLRVASWSLKYSLPSKWLGSLQLLSFNVNTLSDILILIIKYSPMVIRF